MNILIPDSWLRQYLKTKATPKQIAEYLSLCSQSVEKLNKAGEDWVYGIEITTNRPDCLSVYGIARELATILPRFNIPAKLKPVIEKDIKLPKIKNGLPLEVVIEEQSLVPRFTALVFDNITIKKSPLIVCERLEKSGCRALNNVIDISNYLMYELGQPMHTFDYDKIAGHKMIVRESKNNESLITLDGQKRILPEGTIVIEDGSKKIIDLCGIMGGANSAVDEKTKRVLLFVQTYDPAKIRNTCQKLSFRTDAASRFEKGVEPEGVIVAIKKAIEMFAENCGAKIAGNLIDIYPNPQKQKAVNLEFAKTSQLIGVQIEKKEITKILTSLGFQLRSADQKSAKFAVPHWRYGDISIEEDLIEEIARIYGYQNLPANLPPLKTVGSKIKDEFYWENKIKDYFKFSGFLEFYTYSMVSKVLLEKSGINPADCIEIANPLNEDLVYMRPSLIPSLSEMLNANAAQDPNLNLFEVANIYKKTSAGSLPKEIKMLTGLMANKDYLTAKNVVETIGKELQLSFEFKPSRDKNNVADIFIGKNSIGSLGFLDQESVVFFDIKLEELTKRAGETKKYQLLPQYPAIIEDLSFLVEPGNCYTDIVQAIKSIDQQVENVSLFDRYQNSLTLRITYRHPGKTLTDSEAQKIREKIIKKLGEKFGIKLRV